MNEMMTLLREFAVDRLPDLLIPIGIVVVSGSGSR
jgi:hypothetical protein